MKKPVFSWDAEDGSALCIIQSRDKTYYGVATCHPNDRDMMSEKTGCEIAYMRACLMSLRGVKDELKTELKGLKKYYHSINTSKYFNPESYEVRRLIFHMEHIEADIAALKILIQEQRKNIQEFISRKEKFYEKIRRNRKADETLVENK